MRSAAAVIWLATLLYAAMLLAAISGTGYHAGHDDFWANCFLGASADISRPATLYNGFFPLGYSLAVKYIGGTDPARNMLWFNVLIASAALAAVSWLAFKHAGTALATGVALGVGVHYAVFRAAITAGPDLPCAALFTCGAVAILSSNSDPGGERDGWRLVTGAALLGLAGLVRYHALVLGVALLMGRYLVAERRLRELLVGLCVTLAVYSPQMLVSAAAGHGLFGNDQAFNVHKMAYGVDWFRVAPGVQLGLAEIIGKSPATFASRYAQQLLGLLPYVALAVVSAAVVPDGARRIAAKSLAVAFAVYSVTAALGGSDRAALPMMHLSWYLGGMLLLEAVCLQGYRAAWRPLAFALMVCGLLAGALWAARNVRADIRLVGQWANDNRLYRLIERSCDVSSSKQVMSTDFKAYFPTTPPFELYLIGGWMQLHPAYRRAYPPLGLESEEQLRDTCRKQGIEAFVLTPEARLASRALGDIYEDGLVRGWLRPKGEFGKYRVFGVRQGRR